MLSKIKKDIEKLNLEEIKNLDEHIKKIIEKNKFISESLKIQEDFEKEMKHKRKISISVKQLYVF